MKLVEGDHITVITAADISACHARVLELSPPMLHGPNPLPFDGFRWEIAGPAAGAHLTNRRALYRYDREGVDWIHGWHLDDAPAVNALKTAWLLDRSSRGL